MTSLAVIFDMDGVLVDSYRPHLLSWQQAARAYGLEMTEAQFARSFGRTSREIIRAYWPQLADEQVAELDDLKERTYREVLHRDFPAMPGASELLAALHDAGFLLAIGSSGPAENVALVRGKLGGAQLISATVDASEVKHGKPEPDVFLIAARKLGVEPRNCAVVEDAAAGIEAARRAGMAAIAITGTTPREVLAQRAHVVIDSLRELSPEAVRDLISAAARSVPAPM